MDRVYLANIPKYKTMLAKLKSEFSALTTTTDWAKLRVEPLLAHVRSLDQLLRSPRFSSEIARLRKGVVMFHADLVYLRTNIDALQKILDHEKRKRIDAQ